MNRDPDDAAIGIDPTEITPLSATTAPNAAREHAWPESAPVLIWSGVVGQALHTLGVRALTLGCRLVLLVIVGKTLAPAQYGVYALVTTMTTFGVVVCGLNLYAYVYRAIPGLSADQQLRLFKSTFIFETLLSTAIAVGILASGQLPAAVAVFQARGYEAVFGLGLVLIVMVIAGAECTHFLTAQARIERANWIDFLAQGSWVLLLAVLWLCGVALDLKSLIVAQILGNAAALVYAGRVIGFRRWWRSHVDIRVIRAGLAFSVPMIVPAVSLYALRLADRPILSHYASLTDVGVYSFAFTFLNTIYSFTAWVIFNTLSPYVYAAHNRDEFERRDMLQTYMLKAAVVSFVLPCLVLFAVSRPIVELVARPGYLPATSVMPAVALSFVLVILAYPAHTLLTLQNRVVLLAGIDVAGMAVGLLFNFILIPRFSYWGATGASILGFATALTLKYGFANMMSSLRLDLVFSLDAELALARHYVRRLREAIV